MSDFNNLQCIEVSLINGNSDFSFSLPSYLSNDEIFFDVKLSENLESGITVNVFKTLNQYQRNEEY